MSLPLTNPSYTGTIVAFLIVFYLHLVRTLRWRRYRAVHDKYTPKYLARTLTPSEAQQVVRLAFAWDMPTLSQYALYVALFEASAIVRAACWSLIWIQLRNTALDIQALPCDKAALCEEVCRRA
jgi:hypothetical protein